MEIINVSKEEEDVLENEEFIQMQNDAETCMTYELRLSRLIGILKRISPKKSGLKAIFNPDLPEIKTVEDRSLDEINSYAEGLLEEIEKKILEHDKKLQELIDRKDKINNDIAQLDNFKDFDFDISHIGESEYIFVKAGIATDFEKLSEQIKNIEKSIIFSKKFGSGKDTNRAVIIASHISEKEKIVNICRDKITEIDLEVTSGIPREPLS